MRTLAAAIAVAAVMEFILIFALELVDVMGRKKWKRLLGWAVLLVIVVSWSGLFVVCCLGSWISFQTGDFQEGHRLAALAGAVAVVLTLCVRYYAKKLENKSKNGLDSLCKKKTGRK